ncbi:hypothetical protein V8E51_003145 [Hyaloscypha variabilis]
MHFSTIAVPAVFAALAAASNETVTVENLTIRDNDGIQAAELTLQPANVTCSANGSELVNYSVALCGNSKYRFAVNGSNSVYGLRLYKELGVAFGLYGEADHVPVYCHAGGNGQDDFVCDQVAALEVTISSA